MFACHFGTVWLKQRCEDSYRKSLKPDSLREDSSERQTLLTKNKNSLPSTSEPGKTLKTRLDQLNRARDLSDLAVPPGNRLERLRGNRVGQYSIRINEQYRVCFYWENGYADQVEIADYH